MVSGSPKRKVGTDTCSEEMDGVVTISPNTSTHFKRRCRSREFSESGDDRSVNSAWSNVDVSGKNFSGQPNDHPLSEETIALIKTPSDPSNDTSSFDPPIGSSLGLTSADATLGTPVDAPFSSSTDAYNDPHNDPNNNPSKDLQNGCPINSHSDSPSNTPCDPCYNANNDPVTDSPSDKSNDPQSDPPSMCLSHPTPDHPCEPSQASCMSSPPWQRATSSIKDRIKMIFDNQEFSDCSVCCVHGGKQKTFSCHKVVLSMTSTKFSSLLLMNTNIHIDLKPEVFEVMLKYIYLDLFVVPSAEAAFDIYRAARDYDILHLFKAARKCVLSKLTLENFWRAFELALENDDKKLALGCCDFLAVNPSLWNTFTNVKRPLALYVVDMKTINVSEETILQAIDAWAVEQCHQAGIVPDHLSKRQFIGPEMMAKIRFLAISPQDFVTYCSSKHSFLTEEEMLSILCCLTVPQSCKLPNWVCSQTTSRGMSEMFRVKRKKRRSAVGGSLDNHLRDVFALGCPSKDYPLGSQDFCTNLRTNKNIVLHGIQVPGLWYPPFNHEGNTSYEENYIVEIRDHENKLLSRASITLDVPFASQIDILFKHRVSLKAHVEYSINIRTRETYFLTDLLSSSAVEENVHFSFEDYVVTERNSYRAISNSVYELATLRSFIIQIMFSVYM
ncbi:BTB/POZ domain-containing protein 6-A [Frankliniella fusca]|uniref:BTB/POZ domain-containing protein 6-A n=1 Tax=Frankliniella fusca TaxID=407009 RepID=A0AAE1HPP5_9NEOP|nr:BTB/POZ domain-containing protein 6-A [Frankliniella fusca]